jgi:deoxyguanosine kinase
MNSKPLKLPQHIAYLAIEGVIGVGKTSLCRKMAERFNSRPVLERAEENPFLTSFYKNRKAAAFQTQVWFLLSRYKQLSETFVQQDLFHSSTTSDYMFAKDKIFASLNLDENELALYNSISRVLEATIPQPDFVIYLQASTDVLMRRVERRGRPYEFNMDADYMEALNQAYNHFFFHYTASPLLIIDSNDIDFVNNPQDFEEIMTALVQTRSGSNYYHPLGSGSRGLLDDRKDRNK